MALESQLAIGIDLGATKIASALVTAQGEVVTTERRSTASKEGMVLVLDNLTQSIELLLRQATGPVAGIGIGSPGMVDPKTGTVRHAVNLGWQEVNLVGEIKDRIDIDIPIYVHKDANAEVLGEVYFGAGQGCENLAYIGIGTGLGGGAMINNQLVIGQTLTAMEIGHLSLDPNGRLCNCGLKGCAETVISGPGILAITRDYMAQKIQPTRLSVGPQLTPDKVVLAAQAGDRLALAVFDEVGSWLGIVIATCVSMFNPARIVIGGGMGRAAFELLLPHAQAELERRVLSSNWQQLQIVPSQLTSSAVGASCLVWHQIEQ